MTFKNKTTKATTTKKYRCTVLAEKTEEETPVVDETIQIASVKQNTFTEFTVTMSNALESVAVSNFSMVRDDDNQVITIKSAALDSSDSTKVTLVVYTSLTDAKTYTVTYTADDEDKTQSSAKVTVTDGTVADVAVTPLEITANVETPIYYQTLDANGVIISEVNANSPASNIDVSWDSLLGTMNSDSSKFILYNVGDTATFTVTYHTYQYDTTTGAELDVISKSFVVTAVEDASTITQYTYTAATGKPFDWSSTTINQTIALSDGDTSAQRYAYFLIKDSNGNDVTEDCGYTVESSDNSIVVADGAVADGVILTPVAVGSAYLMIKNTSGNVVYTLPITVGAKRTLSTFKLSSSTVNVSSTATVAAPETNVYADITALDQYGEGIDVTCTDTNKTDSSINSIILPTEDDGIGSTIRVVGANNSATTSYNYYITATDALGKSMSTTLKVNSIVASGTETYSVVFMDQNTSKVVSSVDTTVWWSGTEAQGLTSVIVAKQSNVVTGAVTSSNVSSVDSVKVTHSDGTVKGSAANSATVVSSAAIAAPDAALTAADGTMSIAATTKTTSGSSIVTKNLGTGTYTVVYGFTSTDGKTKTAKASFTVADYQTAVTATVKKTSCGTTNSLLTVLNDSDYISYYYGDVEVTDDTTAINVSYAVSNASKNAYVKTVTITVPVADTGVYMVTTVSVGKTFVTTNPSWSK